MLEPLLPKKLSKDDPSYKAVVELAKILDKSFKENKLKNIALTGPFGSGKSSVLYTLQEDVSIYEYLPISLATLQADENPQNEESSKNKPNLIDNNEAVENLNRKIEYSILQQLIYREKVDSVPNSRFRRIVHLSDKQLEKYSGFTILFIISLIIVFEPPLFKVDSIYNFFNWGKWNILFDLLFCGYILWALYKILKSIIKSYCNSKLNKLNLKDGEIEIIENNSIFNKHLDEILYFFQITNYNVVIIEDLDRFGTANIFLKLRELNFLINESKIVNRHIVFLYAVKDDIFMNEERTKFFDFISTVIPVINPSNSKEKLKEALITRGCKENEIADDDLSEMAFFIQDMRILTNIANEYCQYKEKLCSGNKQQLNLTKLLAMIVYKNYHPKDFAQLHKREGKVYKCIRSKAKFINFALKSLDAEKKQLATKKTDFDNTHHLKTKELKLLFLNEISRTLNLNIFSIYINGGYKTFDEIVNNTVLFDELKTQETLNCCYNHLPTGSASRSDFDFKFSKIDGTLNFSNRLNTLKESFDLTFKKETQEIQLKELRLKSLKLNVIISNYRIGDNDDYKAIELSPLMDVFIRRGFLDEDYYDYISYFYKGMISPSDRDLLLSIKTQKRESFDYHIDKIENFIKELKLYMFEDDAIFNNEILDFIIESQSPQHKEYLALIMDRIERPNAPLEFLAQYYINGKWQRFVFSHFIEWEKTNSWQQIIGWKNTNAKDILIEASLKYGGALNNIQQKWINMNFDFLVKHFDAIGLTRCSEIIEYSNFNHLTDYQEDLIDCVINNNSYSITQDNLIIIVSHLCKSDKTVVTNNLNYTYICSTGKSALINYIKQNISIAIHCFKDSNKDESTESMLYILNNENLDISIKESYLKNQKNQINSFNEIEDESLYDLAVKLFLIKPTWECVSDYYQYKGHITKELIGYIGKFKNELQAMHFSNSIENKRPIFQELFGQDILANDIYSYLLESFDLDFDDYDKLKELSKDKLNILLKNDRLPFTSDNISILNETPILADYLIYHSKEFIDHLNYDYNLSIEVASALLNSANFDVISKRAIIDILPENVICDKQLGEVIIKTLISSKNIGLDYIILCSLISNTSLQINDLRVKLSSYIIRNLELTELEIKDLVIALGSDYTDILDTSKRTTIKNNNYNKELLELIKDRGIISSYKEDKNTTLLRVYHKTQ